MRRSLGLVLIALSAGCATPAPDAVEGERQGVPARAGIPITITNGDDEAAGVEVTLYNAVTGVERTTIDPFDLAPGASTTIRVEPTRERDDAFHVLINGFVAVSSDFAGCEIGAIDDPLPEELAVVVLPNGEPDACTNR